MSVTEIGRAHATNFLVSKLLNELVDPRTEKEPELLSHWREKAIKLSDRRERALKEAMDVTRVFLADESYQLLNLSHWLSLDEMRPGLEDILQGQLEELLFNKDTAGIFILGQNYAKKCDLLSNEVFSADFAQIKPNEVLAPLRLWRAENHPNIYLMQTREQLTPGKFYKNIVWMR